MYYVNGNTITISKGDTGALKVTAVVVRRDTGNQYTFGERDRALFSIKNNAGQLIKQKSYPITNNQFVVIFSNKDTDQLNIGQYTWDIRYVINPYYDDDPPEGTWTAYENLTFPVAAGDKCMHEGTYYTAAQAISTSEDWNAEHWNHADYRIPVDGDQIITPNTPMTMTLLNVVGEI